MPTLSSELTTLLAEITKRLDVLAGLPSQVDEITSPIEVLSNKYEEILDTHSKQGRQKLAA